MKQSKLLNQAVVVALALGMVGCAVAPVKTPVADTTTTAVRISGTLRISITWPSKTYNTALLPDSTNRIVVAVKDTHGATAAYKEIVRNSEQTVTTSLRVQAGSEYNIEVDGYRDTTHVAHGAASGVNVKSGRTTTVPSIEMLNLEAPAINSVTNNSSGQSSVAKIGDTITLQGINLGAEASLSLAISLNGTDVPAGNITRVGTGSIQVVVPAGTTCGTMSVKVDNVPVQTSNPLWIVNSVSLPATASVLNHDLTGITLEPTIGWLGNSNIGGAMPPDPLYTVDPADQGTVTGDVFRATATSAGPVNVTPKMGSLLGSAMAITILPSIDSVSLDTSAGTVNATSEGSEPTTSYPNTCSFVATVNGDGFHNGVNWSSSNAALATVDSNGVVTANNAGTKGTVTITATSKDDPSKKATATVTVTNSGDVEVGVD